MGITRKQSIYLGLATIIVFFAFSIYMLKRAGQIQTAKDVEKESSQPALAAPKFDLAVPITLDKFHRSEVKDGKKQWEITADTGKYSPKTSTAELENPVMSLFQKDGAKITLTATTAIVHITGTNLEKAETYGNVVLNYNDKVKLTTEQANYDKLADTVVAPGFVSIDNEGVQITGNDLHVNVTKREFEIRNNVSTEIRPRKK